MIDMNRFRQESGFTLVELFIAVTVMALLLSVGIPSFQATVNNNRRTAQVNEFVTSLTLARSEALKRGNAVTVCRASNFSAAVPTCGNGNGWEDGWVVFNDENGDGSPNNAIDVLRLSEPVQGNNITLRGEANVATRVLYAATGRVGAPTAGNATIGNIVWCDARGAGDNARVINIAATGRITTTAGNAGTNCTPP